MNGFQAWVMILIFTGYEGGHFENVCPMIVDEYFSWKRTRKTCFCSQFSILCQSWDGKRTQIWIPFCSSSSRDKQNGHKKRFGKMVNHWIDLRGGECSVCGCLLIADRTGCVCLFRTYPEPSPRRVRQLFGLCRSYATLRLLPSLRSSSVIRAAGFRFVCDRFDFYIVAFEAQQRLSHCARSGIVKYRQSTAKIQAKKRWERVDNFYGVWSWVESVFTRTTLNAVDLCDIE